MKDNRMDNIVECAYKMDNGYVEVWFTDGNMLRIKCEEVEAALRTTEQSLAKLHRLLDNKPIEYVVMALSGEMQAYCDIEDDMVKGMFGTIVQGYLKKGYNRATAFIDNQHGNGLFSCFNLSLLFFLFLLGFFSEEI